MKPPSRARLGVFIFVVVLFDPCASGFAEQQDRALIASGISPKRAEGTPRAREPRPEPRADIGAVTGAAGQAGYVHYFVITGPDGETETQVGIELADGRIVWSFPEAGVFVSPFMAWGSVSIGAMRYDVEHLFGLRPFRDQRSVRALQRALPSRVEAFTDPWTPYCAETRNTDRYCLSCLGFVLRVLYPGRTRAYPALPVNFRSARKDVYSTEDLLLYLAGVPLEGPGIARARRIQSLDIPAPLRDELSRIVAALDEHPSSPRAKKSREHDARNRDAALPAAGGPRAQARRS
jgi:hypothetical protein